MGGSLVRFRIDPETSRVRIEARSSVHPIRGEANGVEGSVELVLDGDEPDLSTAPSARIELPIERLRSSNRLYDTEMQRRVEASKHPRIVGELGRVWSSGAGGRYRVQGNLTFHGQTKAVEAEVHVEVTDSRRLVADWEQTIDIREFGVNPPRILMLRVHPDVVVTVHLEADAGH